MPILVGLEFLTIMCQKIDHTTAWTTAALHFEPANVSSPALTSHMVDTLFPTACVEEFCTYHFESTNSYQLGLTVLQSKDRLVL